MKIHESGSVDPALIEEAQQLLHVTFGDDFEPSEPVLGAIIATGNVEISPNMRSFLTDGRTINTFLLDDNKDLAGISVSIPIGMMNPERTDESADTVYIYFTVVTPEYRGVPGAALRLIRRTLEDLAQKGFSYVETDAEIDNGLAGSVSRIYRRKGAIISQRDHNDFGLGDQRFFRLELAKLLPNSEQ